MSRWDAKTKLVFYGADDYVTDADRSSCRDVSTSTASCTTLIPAPASGVLIESASVSMSKVSTVTVTSQNKEELMNRLPQGHTECNLTNSSGPKAASTLTSAHTECNVTYSSEPKAASVPTTGLPISFHVGSLVGPSRLQAFNTTIPGTDLARRTYDDRNETRRIRAQSCLPVTLTDDFPPLPTYPQTQTSYDCRQRYPNEFHHQFGTCSEGVYETRRMETRLLQPQVGTYSDEIRSGNGCGSRRNKPIGYRRPISKGQSYFSDLPTGLGSHTYPAQSPSAHSMTATSGTRDDYVLWKRWNIHGVFSQRMYQELTAYKPDVVILNVGGNDINSRSSPKDISEGILSLVDEFLRQGVATVYFCEICERGNFTKDNMLTKKSFNAQRRKINSLVQRHKDVRFLKLKMRFPKDYDADKVHFSVPEGQTRYEQFLTKTLLAYKRVIL